jgi:simple sugar transport system substrate-binding protein
MKIINLLLLAITLAFSSVALAKKPLYMFVSHASVGAASGVFWQAVKKGMEDACELYEADCQMVYLQSQDGNIGEEVANFELAIAAGADGIATTIYDTTSFDGPIDEALAEGINVISYNIDDENSPNNRQAYIGQSLRVAGYDLMVDLNKRFLPQEGPLHILVGVNAPGQVWSEMRTSGEVDWIEEFAAANPGRSITFDKLDVGYAEDVMNRASAYILANPQTNVYVSSGLWGPELATALEENSYKPGEIIIGGFDVVPSVVECLKSGWCHATVDQQPYLQGYLPIVQFFLKDKYGLGHWSVNTGALMLHKEDMAALEEFSKAGVR